jgi:hypothetical protein
MVTKNDGYLFQLLITQYQEVFPLSHGHPAMNVLKPGSIWHCMVETESVVDDKLYDI